MIVQSVKNQYRGINAHLQSNLQSGGDWNEFHTNHITDLTRLLRDALMPLGYIAKTEPGLQIRRSDAIVGRPEADVAIFDLDPLRSMQGVVRADTPYEATIAMPVLLELDEEALSQYRAVGIYTTSPDRPQRGELVAWIELLSPSNKPGRQDGTYYQHKRLELLHTGIVIVELDYLHETPPTFRMIPAYRNRKQPTGSDPDAHPYRIVALDPRPTLREGQAVIYAWDVDQPIPTVTIPLSGAETVAFDFDPPYQKTFAEMRYGREVVNYAALPDHFDRYSEADQARIAARMLAVVEAAQRGEDLETAMLAPEMFDLEAALARLDAIANRT